MTSIYAIKTGTCFTAVIVDSAQNQCLVAAEDGGHIYYPGLAASSVRKAATDCGGVGYKTLRSLMEDYPQAERRRDLDC